MDEGLLPRAGVLTVTRQMSRDFKEDFKSQPDQQVPIRENKQEKQNQNHCSLTIHYKEMGTRQLSPQPL